MATAHHTEAQQVLHQAAEQLAALHFMDQDTARELARMAEAVANLFMVVFYQAETGRATPTDFREAKLAVERLLARH
ncbi:type I toxin-antitoxin system ptaRNA1 family toxin [Burkholderia cenocepacia]|uniref:Type I toxin-antitoxin system ptaRNA1 family toxin n=1 Tax=Burkholderia cenocepacia TaxID=95486 RepID=A0ABD4UNN1_9BURK|nr:type I toxin-antitoxin system ptaRNA1 family toxin [Burkholderia cenocepacia]MCW3699893.1 type I toxin-antitoxin system ptaRNA1 family toxin [Burkholderia cenocepacia]MCW3707554.1 type I toxin-antitoxin system ptaRNA1 family toxin [Burkholderia cenocepacia]MCW3715808.1 type I toxin-antitoxin system ptaRNA1 family toxin [Burkholderia cenocepacia]MCW3723878.1 type I toxin-antitoxin system ptaRNA1 family toxin [Burkholderia cenocepacia]MCW3733248.1 type I toxin-antitoxin system ptaRNA1 family 